MTNSGTGIYYKPGLPLNKYSQIISDIGVHFDTPAQFINFYGTTYQNRSIVLEFLLSYKRELLKESIVGIIDPIIILQGGSSIKINNLSLENIDKLKYIYATGIGFQFYNGRILNEMLLKFNQLLSKERSIAFQLSIYWR